MGAFAWALAGFVLLHVGVSATGLRAVLVRTIGEWPYRGLFSLASAALLAWMIVSFGAMRGDPFNPLNEAFWAPPDWLRGVGVGLSLFALALIVTGLLTPGPTSVGFEKRGLNAAEPARGVLRITRHPFLWGVAIWGAGHLMANGERFALMLFGALAFMALFGARSIDRKARARDPEAYARFEAVTSNAPFAAIVQGRNRLAVGEIGWRGLAGVIAAVLVALAHERLFGVPAL